MCGSIEVLADVPATWMAWCADSVGFWRVAVFLTLALRHRVRRDHTAQQCLATLVAARQTLDPKGLMGNGMSMPCVQKRGRQCHTMHQPRMLAHRQWRPHTALCLLTRHGVLGVLRHALVLTNTVAHLCRGTQHRLTRKRFTCTATCTEQLSNMFMPTRMMSWNSDDLEQLFLESKLAPRTSILARDYKTWEA